MPFDTAGFLPRRTLTERERLDLVALHLMRARIAAPRTWCQHADVNPSGARCLLGWANYYTHSGQPPRALLQRLEPFIPPFRISLDRDDPDYAMERVVKFNDRSSTRKAHVVAVLDKAIASLAGEE